MRQQPGRRAHIKAAGSGGARLGGSRREDEGGVRKSGLADVQFPAQKRESLGFLFYVSVIIQK